MHISTSEGGEADILVLGAGVVGMTTAYSLARRGFSVIIADRAGGPAEGCSFANGAQLSYAYTDALAQSGLLAKIPALLAGLDPAFRVRISVDPDFLRWGLAFLRNCSGRHFRENTEKALILALESRAAMADLLARHALEFGHTIPGKMHLFRSKASFEQARIPAGIKQAYGIRQEFLTPSQAKELEPALAGTGSLAGAVWTPSEEVGDPHLFCRGLLDVLRHDYGLGEAFHFPVSGLSERNNRVVATNPEGKTISARFAVVCLGADAAEFLARMKIHTPVQPMKGYSFTAPCGVHPPEASITDTARKIVFCRLNGKIRVAGLAELNNRDRHIDEARLRVLVDGARAALPQAADYGAADRGWAGLRPMTPDSLPIVRQVRDRIFLNIGHGMLGWTLAAGAAERVGTLIASTIR